MPKGKYTVADIQPQQQGQYTLADVDSSPAQAEPPPAMPKNAVISNQPKFGTMDWLKTKLFQGGDAVSNALPAAGATIGGAVGAPEGGPIGAIGGAGIGGMAGSAGQHILRRMLGFQESNDPNAVSGDIAKQGVTQAAVQSLSEALPFLAPYLKNAAVKQYERALAPTTKPNKVIAQEIAPELIQRGESGSLEGLQNRATAKINQLSPELNQAYQQVAQATPKISGAGTKVLSDLDTLKQSYMPGGVVAQPEAVKAIQGVQDIVKQYGPDISPDHLRRLRQIFEEVPAQRGAYAGADLSTNYTLNAQQQAADSIRGVLNKNPDIGALNKEVSFWLDVQRVTSQSGLRRTGQEGGLMKVLAPLFSGVAGAVGFGTGGAKVGLEATLGTAGLAALTQALRSPAWRTVSAVGKSRLADALASGSAGAVASTLARLGLAGHDALTSNQQRLQANQR